MKIQEMKPVNEDLADTIGDYGASRVRQLGSKIKGMFGKGDPFADMTGEQRQVMDMFIRDLVGDASGALAQAIATGLVVPTSQTRTPNNTRKPAPTPQPTQVTQPTPTPTTPTAGTTVDIDQLKQRSTQAAQAAQTDRQTAAQQIKATQAANAEKAKQDAAIKAAKDAAMAKPAYQRDATDKLAITKAQRLGIREANKNNQKYSSNTFSKLNRIFEGILNVNEAMSVGQFLKQRWLPAYAKKQGINYDDQQYNDNLNRIINKIDQEYITNKGKTSLPMLGQLMYTIRQAQTVTPNPPQIKTRVEPSIDLPVTTPMPAPQTIGSDMVTQIETMLNKLKTTDAVAYKNLLAKLKAAQ